MKFTLAYAVSAAVAVAAQKGKGGGGAGAAGGGAGTPVNGKTPGVLASGPYKAGYWAEPGLPRHTVFAPLEPPKDGDKLPVMVWGNGACSANGTFFRRSLFEVASHGFWVIANGMPTGSGQTTSAMQVQAINWVKQNAGKGKYSFIDGTRIAAAGQSCGGLETYEVAINPSVGKDVSVVGIFNSGEFGSSSKSLRVTQPVFYFLGGSTDIAYANGERDYKNIAKTHVKWKANLDVGHMATWSQTNGGKFGKAEWMWLDWTLRGNAKSGDFFTKGGAQADGWKVESANMGNIKIFPPYSARAPAAPRSAPPPAEAAAPAAPAAPPAEEGEE
jgi:hypothetical protein